MKAQRPMGVPKGMAGVHSDHKGELRLLTSEHPKDKPSSASRGETLLKEILDFIFQQERYYDNHRPKWLSGLELDRYYPRLKIAFEYQGFQHSYFVPRYHSTVQDYKNQRERDKKKQQLCRRKKVVLVRIYYWHLSVGQVCQWTVRALRKLKRWPHTREIVKIIRAKLPKAVGGKNKKAINEKCAAYKKLVKANYDSKKWVKHHQNYARKHYPKGYKKVYKQGHKETAKQIRSRDKERNWSKEIAQAEKELREAHAELN